jgi:hypothetical protein
MQAKLRGEREKQQQQIDRCHLERKHFVIAGNTCIPYTSKTIIEMDF